MTDPAIKLGTPNTRNYNLRGINSNNVSREESNSPYKIREAAFQFVNLSDAHRLEASYSNDGSTQNLNAYTLKLQKRMTKAPDIT